MTVIFLRVPSTSWQMHVVCRCAWEISVSAEQDSLCPQDVVYAHDTSFKYSWAPKVKKRDMQFIPVIANHGPSVDRAFDAGPPHNQDNSSQLQVSLNLSIPGCEAT